jgi:hypothetical protein
MITAHEILFTIAICSFLVLVGGQLFNMIQKR